MRGEGAGGVLAGKGESEGFSAGVASRARFLRMAGLGASLSLFPGALLSPARAQTVAGPDILSSGEYPIVAWWPPPPVPEPEPEAETARRYAELAGAGFNAAIGGNGVNNISASRRALEACQGQGLRFVISDEQLRRAIDGTAARDRTQEESRGVLRSLTGSGGDLQAQAVGNREVIQQRIAELAGEFGGESAYPALAGISLYDEPGTSLFGDLRYAKDQVAQQFGGDELPYVNVWPSYASARYALEARDYANYLDRYMNQETYQNAVAPPVLSFDHYPLLANGRITNDFFYNHAVIRDFARRFNVPSWAFVQSMGFDGRRIGLSRRRKPDETEIFWQINVALAYGAEGIQYFTYWTPEDNEVDFGNALITAQGERTELYGYAARANGFLRKVGAVLLPLVSTGAYHAGERDLPRGASRFRGNGSVGAASGDPTILGFFKSANARYVLVVNRSPNRPARARLTIRRTVRIVEEFVPYEGSSGEFVRRRLGRKPPRSLKLSLGGGRSRLYRLRPA